MSDSALDLKLGRLASSLLLDLDEVDAINFNRRDCSNQKAQLIIEALTEAVRLATSTHDERDNSAGVYDPRPASLMDHGG